MMIVTESDGSLMVGQQWFSAGSVVCWKWFRGGIEWCGKGCGRVARSACRRLVRGGMLGMLEMV